MKIRLTKKFVIKALKAEVVPQPGNWCDAGSHKLLGEIRNDPSCRRCAVGAVVMQVLTVDAGADDVDIVAQEAAHQQYGANDANYRARAIAMIKFGRPFDALSYFFESAHIYDRLNGRALLRFTTKFVEEHFPATVILDTDGVRKVKKIFPRVR